MTKARSGGGINSNKVVQSRGVVPGKPAKGVVPQGTIGLQRVTTTGYKEPTVPSPKSVALGNETAKAAGQGPGAGRTVSKAGSQQGPGPAAPMTSGDPLKGWE